MAISGKIKYLICNQQLNSFYNFLPSVTCILPAVVCIFPSPVCVSPTLVCLFPAAESVFPAAICIFPAMICVSRAVTYKLRRLPFFLNLNIIKRISESYAKILAN